MLGLGRQGGERGVWGAAVGRWEGGGEMGRRHREVDGHGAADPGRKLSSIYAPCH